MKTRLAALVLMPYHSCGMNNMKSTLTKLFIASLVFASVTAYTQSSAHRHNHSAGRQAAPMAMNMPMMDMEKCMADMKAGSARLDALAAKMNNASGADKIDAIAAVVNEMLAQKKKMDEMCMQMMSHMSNSSQMNAAGERHKTKRSPRSHTKHHAA